MKELIAIQSELKVPKNQFNSFGNYSFRSTEDIIEAVKPLLQKYKCALVCDSTVVNIGTKNYIIVTANLFNESGLIASSKSQAAESESKKGFDLAQLSGSTESYAKKYALGNLFAIDDAKDADSTNKHGNESTEPNKQGLEPFPTREDDAKTWLNAQTKEGALTTNFKKALEALNKGYTINDLRGYWKISKETAKHLEDNTNA